MGSGYSYVSAYTYTTPLASSVDLDEIKKVRSEIARCTQTLEERKADARNLNVAYAHIEPCVFTLDHVRSTPNLFIDQVHRMYPNSTVLIRNFREETVIDDSNDGKLVDIDERNVATITVHLRALDLM